MHVQSHLFTDMVGARMKCTITKVSHRTKNVIVSGEATSDAERTRPSHLLAFAVLQIRPGDFGFKLTQTGIQSKEAHSWRKFRRPSSEETHDQLIGKLAKQYTNGQSHEI